ncbi:MAG: cysteine hydrolase family protein [Candidatus Delongbacteria bacterium]
MPGTLLLIDLQNDYFPGGACELEGAEAALGHAGRLLAAAREAGWPVVHVQHLSLRPGAGFFLPGTPGAEIHPALAPRPGEAVVVKHQPNSFRDTGLEALLRPRADAPLLVAGMMTHMCVDSSVRAAWELGFAVRLAGQACATRALGDPVGGVPAAQVQAAFLAALHGLFARVEETSTLLDLLRA